jgi:hypothetical protein
LLFDLATMIGDGAIGEQGFLDARDRSDHPVDIGLTEVEGGISEVNAKEASQIGTVCLDAKEDAVAMEKSKSQFFEVPVYSALIELNSPSIVIQTQKSPANVTFGKASVVGVPSLDSRRSLLSVEPARDFNRTVPILFGKVNPRNFGKFHHFLPHFSANVHPTLEPKWSCRRWMNDA